MRNIKAQSESVERAAWQDLVDGTPDAVRRELGVEAVEVNGTLLLSARGIDNMLFNRAIGLGTDAGVVRQDEVDETVAHFEERGIERYFVHVDSALRTPSLRSWFRARQVVPYHRSWMKFVWEVSGSDNSLSNTRTPGQPEVCQARPQDAGAVAAMLATGFDMPASAHASLAAVVHRPNWHVHVVRSGDEIAAAGALFVEDHNGYLAFAATRPLFRRRGYQRALMVARMQLARELGCSLVFTETGLPIAGEPNSSFRNMLRLGFDEHHVRDNYVPVGVRWASEQNH